MAHFAKVENNIVKEVIVVADADCGNGNFPASESVGQAFIASIGLGGEWLQTSYNSNFRGKYAGAGMIYNAELDEFVVPTIIEE
jgi:hypothetical protein